MVDYDSALPVRGNVQDGDAIYNENTLLVIAGTDSANYQAMLVDTGGRPRIVGAAADDSVPVSDPVLTAGLFETDGGVAVQTGDVTTLALDAYGRTITVGQTADGAAIDANAYPVLMAGQDGTNVQTLRTDNIGRLIVNVGGGTNAGITYATQNLIKDTPTTVVSLVGTEIVKRVNVAGSGLMKAELKLGAAGSEATIMVGFNSTAMPNIVWDFYEDGLDVGTGSSLIVSCTNLENRSSPSSDFSGYGTISTEDAT